MVRFWDWDHPGVLVVTPRSITIQYWQALGAPHWHLNFEIFPGPEMSARPLTVKARRKHARKSLSGTSLLF